MKKTFFNPANYNKNVLPNIVSRRLFGSSRTGRTSDGTGIAYKTDAPEEAELLAKIEQTVRKELATRATKQEVENIVSQLGFLKKNEDGTGGFPLEALRAMADEKTGAMAMLTAQGVELQKLKNTIASQPKDMSIRSQCESYLKANADAIKNIRNQVKAELPPFELELRSASSPMTPSTVMPGGTTYINRFEIQPGINELLRPEPTFWDFIKKGSTNSETYIWLNKRPTDGAAGFIGPGVYKPAVSFTVNTELSNAKKVAVNEKMATELLEDVDGFASWVETELRYQLMQKVNDTLQGNGAGSSTVPEGLQHMSIPYDAATGVSTTNPNFWDVIKAGATMLRVTRFRGQIVAFVNPVDLANGVMTKANVQGQLFVPPVTGATIVEDLNMTLGYVQWLAVDYYKVLIYKAFRMAWGWENDDFTKNLVTVIGEMRLHQFHSQNYDGFAIYDSIENVKAAIGVAP